MSSHLWHLLISTVSLEGKTKSTDFLHINLIAFFFREMRRYFENAYDLDEGLFSAIKGQ